MAGTNSDTMAVNNATSSGKPTVARRCVASMRARSARLCSLPAPDAPADVTTRLLPRQRSPRFRARERLFLVSTFGLDIRLAQDEICEACQKSDWMRSEEHTSELQSPCNLVCRLLLEKKKKKKISIIDYFCK